MVTRAGTAAFADPDLGRFSLIVPILTMSTIGKEELANLLGAVQGGVGLGGYHGGMADAFRDEPEYQFMVGGQWVAHPGNVIDYHVDVTRPDDPVMAGIAARFPYRSEQYYLHVDPRVEVLATTTFSGEHAEWIAGAVVPQVWKTRYGRGGSSSARSGTWRPSSTCRRWRRSCAAGWSGRRPEPAGIRGLRRFGDVQLHVHAVHRAYANTRISRQREAGALRRGHP